MAFGFAPQTTAEAAPRLSRILGADEWAASAIPSLNSPRDLVKEVCDRHLPSPSTVVIAVLDPTGRTVASASFAAPAGSRDGWEHRNAILHHLRRVIPHDLRLRSPVRTAVLLVCRDGIPGWTPADGAWMWGLRDACTLHGLRCGAYVTLTSHGWLVLGDGRGGRRPHAGSWSERAARGGAVLPVGDGVPEAVRRHVAR
ncbi:MULTISPECIES: hypothetical protein [Streptomycetaceae]|uniref:Uncharacterized protein n=1 Tax=Streptantibioticus cattleyicolor (strain ATCC 35852 / DSM 46488 / JCM 4925 / NBRC 14057 / NRRL 8057) TaxID=1003195 RepID=F8JVP3_STREN|nr:MULTISPECIES: hypothetical protein [Streptomycetaceae]AEW96953.1 hypothetical protein SCATT_45820 [Streptantibioticus cattleyicolor NRRL 8057 = DSM 46488]MYS61425.1 hypothetical protein [Streptomyces sp. SID5468]CCB77280.1 conserved protein of unknown function [Streptantibioticus cattleyicolor NRRL 8057 = DSM 46488]